MDISDTHEEAAFRLRARTWLEQNAEPRRDGDDLAWFRALPDDEKLERARAWQSRKARAGFAAITLPVALGGSGGTPIEHIIYRQEEARFRVPFGVYEIGLGMCLPTLAALGSAELAQRYVPPGVRGEQIWCQLFSEPDAGSDVASLRTSAQRRDDHWVINGQKVWTTGAHFSDYGMLLARTDPGAARHAGLTMFIVDMRAPGVTIRPIRQMTGESDFNEVFFSDVVVKQEDRITEVGAGWAGAITTLMFERMNVGADIGLAGWDAALGVADDIGLGANPLLRQKLADWYIQSQGVALYAYRTLTSLSQGRPPGPEQSIAKLVMARQAQDIGETLLDARAESGALAASSSEPSWAAIQRAWQWGAGMRIAGGADEVLRNIIAERVLGLPREPSPLDHGQRNETVKKDRP